MFRTNLKIFIIGYIANSNPWFCCWQRDFCMTLKNGFDKCSYDRAEQGLRMCRDGRGLESNLVSFSKGFSKRPHILAIIKVDSEYSRLPFKLKLDYFILYWILVSTFVIFSFFLLWTKEDARTKPKTVLSFECVHFQA